MPQSIKSYITCQHTLCNIQFGISFVEMEKQRELEGGDELPEPEEVQQARDELKSLGTSKEKTEKLKNKISKELDNAKDRAARIEEVSSL